MYAEADAETLVVEVVVVGWPAVEEGVAGVDAEFELLPSEAQHQLRLEQEVGVVVGLFDAPLALVVDRDFVPTGAHYAAFEAHADVEVAIGQLSPAEVDLAVDKVVVAVDVVFFCLRFAAVVEVGDAVSVAGVAFQHGFAEGEIGAGGSLGIQVFEVGDADGGLRSEFVYRRIGERGVDGRRHQQRRRHRQRPFGLHLSLLVEQRQLGIVRMIDDARGNAECRYYDDCKSDTMFFHRLAVLVCNCKYT